MKPFLKSCNVIRSASRCTRAPSSCGKPGNQTAALEGGSGLGRAARVCRAGFGGRARGGARENNSGLRGDNTKNGQIRGAKRGVVVWSCGRRVLERSFHSQGAKGERGREGEEDGEVRCMHACRRQCTGERAINSKVQPFFFFLGSGGGLSPPSTSSIDTTNKRGGASPSVSLSSPAQGNLSLGVGKRETDTCELLFFPTPKTFSRPGWNALVWEKSKHVRCLGRWHRTNTMRNAGRKKGGKKVAVEGEEWILGWRGNDGLCACRAVRAVKNNGGVPGGVCVRTIGGCPSEHAITTD